MTKSPHTTRPSKLSPAQARARQAWAEELDRALTVLRKVAGVEKFGLFPTPEWSRGMVAHYRKQILHLIDRAPAGCDGFIAHAKGVLDGVEKRVQD